jgi:hypothetical protein
MDALWLHGLLAGLSSNNRTVLIIMTYKTSPLLLAAFFLMGCASPLKVKVNDFYDMPADALETFKNLQVLPEQNLSDGSYTEIGTVSSSSCRRGSDSDVLAENSKTYQFVLGQLQMSAAEMGAGFITTPKCVVQDDAESPGNCTASLSCTSRAFTG